MKRKSVYLFSVAILGFSLAPCRVWADEAAETVVPVVTAELVESPVMEEQPASEVVVTDDVHAEPEVLPQVIEVITEPITDTSEVAIEEVEVGTIPSEHEAMTVSDTEEVTTTEMSIQEKAARTTTPVLKDQNDGKIVDHDKTITDENAKIPAEYNFMPNFDHLDGIEITSANGYRELSSSFAFDLEKATKGSITVVFKNVGTYNGKVIDMKVTVKDWTILTTSGRSQQLNIHKKNGITMNGIKDVLLNYAFLDNLTASTVNVSGFFNFTDIDLLQSIDLFDNNNVQNYYVTKGNELYYKIHNGYIKIGEINRKNTNPLDMDHWLTYTYKGVSNFDVRYNQDYETGAVFNYTYQAPVVIEEVPTGPEMEEPEVTPETPEKEVAEENKVEETPEVKSEVVNLAVKTEKAGVVETKVTEAEPLKQAMLPQTNVQSSSIFTILGGTCLVLLSAIFLNKKKV